MKNKFILGLVLVTILFLTTLVNGGAENLKFNDPNTMSYTIFSMDCSRELCYALDQLSRDAQARKYGEEAYKRSVEEKWFQKKYSEFLETLKLVDGGECDSIVKIDNLAGEFLDEAHRFQEIKKWAIGRNDRSWLGHADEVYKFCVEMSAELELLTGRLYVTAKKYNLAKEAYRKVVIQYTGDNWKSYVKMAEFALEDLKSAEK